MKKTFIAFATLILLTQLSFAQNTKTPAAKTKTPAAKPVTTTKTVVVAPSSDGMKNGVDSISYAIGMNIAGNLKQQNLNL